MEKLRCVLARWFLAQSIKLARGVRVRTQIIYQHGIGNDPLQKDPTLGVKLTFIYPDNKNEQFGWYSTLDTLYVGNRIREMWNKQNPNEILSWMS